LGNHLNPNNCTSEIIEEYYDGNHYYLFIRQASQADLYLFNDGALIYYVIYASDAILPAIYGTATDRIWSCGC